MIYITGDTHIPIDVHKLSTKVFTEQKQLNKHDYVIICGDCGLIWNNSNEDKYWINWFKNKNFTLLFIDGNHENFNLLNNYPIINWNGGNVHKISDNIFHLMRGQIYNINNKKFFTFGGAKSRDIKRRKENINYWKTEMPSEEELQQGILNLELNNWKVDYIITHCCSSSLLNYIKIYKNLKYIETDYLTDYFNFIEYNTKYKHWFFGHHHLDIKDIKKNQTCVFNDIIKI